MTAEARADLLADALQVLLLAVDNLLSNDDVGAYHHGLVTEIDDLPRSLLDQLARAREDAATRLRTAPGTSPVLPPSSSHGAHDRALGEARGAVPLSLVRADLPTLADTAGVPEPVVEVVQSVDALVDAARTGRMRSVAWAWVDCDGGYVSGHQVHPSATGGVAGLHFALSHTLHDLLHDGEAPGG